MDIKMKLKTALIPLLSISPFAQAAVTVELPNDINLLVVNEQKAQQTHINSDGFLELPDGTNQFIFDFRRAIKPGSSQSTHFESSPIIVTFNSQNTNLDFSLPKMKTMDDYRAFDKNPSIILKTKQSASVPYEIDKLNKALVSLLANYEEATVEYNRKNNIQLSTTPTLATEDIVVSNKIKSVDNPDIHTNKVNSLKSDFIKMSEEEKQSFLSWAIKNM